MLLTDPEQMEVWRCWGPNSAASPSCPGPEVLPAGESGHVRAHSSLAVATKPLCLSLKTVGAECSSHCRHIRASVPLWTGGDWQNWIALYSNMFFQLLFSPKQTFVLARMPFGLTYWVDLEKVLNCKLALAVTISLSGYTGQKVMRLKFSELCPKLILDLP